MHHHSQSITTNQGQLSVQKCQCGGIHICIGGVSVNLARDTAEYLSMELSKALYAEEASLGQAEILPLFPLNQEDPH